MQKWRLINSGFQSGAMNMALDEALLRSVASGSSLPVLRFYRWEPATVTLGYAQSVAKDVNLEVCRQAGFELVRRTTGGRAVLHDQEVTYAVIAPLQTEKFGASVLDCYRVISEVLLKTLTQLQLPAQLVPGKTVASRPGASAKSVCFSAPSQYELVIDGCKVAGSAQKRFGSTFLQHGSIPLEMDVGLLGRLLNADSDLSLQSALGKVGWLRRYLTQPLTVTELEQKLTAEFASELGIEWLDSEPTAEESLCANQLVAEKFANSEWTFRY